MKLMVQTTGADLGVALRRALAGRAATILKRRADEKAAAEADAKDREGADGKSGQ
ncbi:MAG: hypothetical protein ACYC10_17140 [Allorhizobium sp.]